MTAPNGNDARLDAFRASKSQTDLAAIFGTTWQNLRFHLYSKKAPAYRSFEIPKASGGLRTISVPPLIVASWQRSLLSLLSDLYEPKSVTHGFVSGRSIRTNAEKHIRRATILNIDLENFFSSIHFGRVRGLFKKHPFNFNDEVSATLAQLCTHAGVLPQGAPTSPIISNLICRRLDVQLYRLAKRHRCIYTRFADDITISAKQTELPSEIVKSCDAYGAAVILGEKLQEIIDKNDFKANQAKSRVQTSAGRQEVTGLVVNRTVNVTRRYVREVRAILHNWKEHGKVQAEEKFYQFDQKNYTRRYDTPALEAHVSGKLSFLRMVRGRGDKVYTRYAILLSKLTDATRSPVLEAPATDVLEFVRETVWVLLGKDSKGDAVQQGTAFRLQGVGFVTARHVLEPNKELKSWVVVRASPPYDEVPITQAKIDPKFDLAVLTTSARAYAQLRRGDQPAHKDEGVLVLGFPNWHTHADHPLRAVTNVVQAKTVSGSKLFGVSYSLLSGASGGPVLDERGRVIGVVVNSNSSAVLPNAFIGIDHIDNTMKAPLVPLPL